MHPFRIGTTNRVSLTSNIKRLQRMQCVSSSTQQYLIVDFCTLTVTGYHKSQVIIPYKVFHPLLSIYIWRLRFLKNLISVIENTRNFLTCWGSSTCLSEWWLAQEDYPSQTQRRLGYCLKRDIIDTSKGRNRKNHYGRSINLKKHMSFCGGDNTNPIYYRFATCYGRKRRRGGRNFPKTLLS